MTFATPLLFETLKPNLAYDYLKVPKLADKFCPSIFWREMRPQSGSFSLQKTDTFLQIGVEKAANLSSVQKLNGLAI